MRVCGRGTALGGTTLWVLRTDGIGLCQAYGATGSMGPMDLCDRPDPISPMGLIGPIC